MRTRDPLNQKDVEINKEKGNKQINKHKRKAIANNSVFPRFYLVLFVYAMFLFVPCPIAYSAEMG